MNKGMVRAAAAAVRLLHPSSFVLLTLILLPLASGCALFRKPNKASIELRRQNQELQEEVQALQEELASRSARIASLEERAGTVPTLSQDRLDRLFTTRRLKFGTLTGGADFDRKRPGDEGLKIYVVPVDQDHHVLKAAGSFVVEAFDTSSPDDALVGRWEFDNEAAAKHWYGAFTRYTYVLPCPWQDGRTPAQPKLHVEVTFTEELTGTVFEDSVDVEVELPPATATEEAPQQGGTGAEGNEGVTATEEAETTEDAEGGQ